MTPSFRALARHRRTAAAVLAGLAVLLGLSAVRPAPGTTVAVLAAARDLAPGSALALEDLRSLHLPAAAVPSGALRPGAAVLGRVVATPVRRGEALTDVRLLGPSLLAAVSGTRDAVAVPVRFADAGAVAVLRPGDRIDVLATSADVSAHAAPPAAGPPGGTPPLPSPGGSGADAARVVATDLAVLAVTGDDPDTPGFHGDGALVVVACSRDVARALAAAATAERLSPVLRAPAPPGATTADPRGPP